MDFNHFSPCFLIAMPELQDPNFEKTVILLTDYKPEGAVGFVINRQSAMTLGNSIRLSEGSVNTHYENLKLWTGGPVEPGHIWMIYNAKALPADILPKFISLGEELAMAHDLSLLTNHEITVDPINFRVVHGYSGWTREQLNAELAHSFWITAPLSTDLIFGVPPQKIWEHAIRKLGVTPDNLVGAASPFLN